MGNQTSLMYYENTLQFSELKTSFTVTHQQHIFSLKPNVNYTEKQWMFKHFEIASKFHKELQHVELNMQF